MGFARAPWLAAPILLLLAPLYLHPIRLPGADAAVSELALLAAVVGVGARAGYDRWSAKHHQLFPRSQTIDWIAAGFVLSALLSLVVTEYLRESARELRLLIVEPVVAFYVVRATIRTPQHIRLVLGTLALSGVAAAGLGLADLAMRGELLALTGRAMAPYSSANHLALFLERCLAAGLAIALFDDRWHRLGWISAAAHAAGILRAVSIGAWIGGAAIALVLISLRKRAAGAVAAGGLIIIFLAGLLILPPERGWDRFNPSTGTGQFRLEIWASSLEMVRDHPLLGVGLDNFLYRYRAEYILPGAWEEPNISHPHNWVLHFWLQLGLPGLMSAIAMAAWLATTAHRCFYHPGSPSDRPLAASALGILIAFLVHGSIDNSYFLVDLALVWWIVLGLLAVSTQQADSLEDARIPAA